MATTQTLRLEFTTDQNKNIRMSIPNPKLPVDSTAVSTAMSTIVAKNIFALPQGSIVKSVGATEVQTDSSTVG